MIEGYGLLRPLLFAIEPETAHRLTIRALAAGLFPRARPAGDRLSRRLLGLDFPNPLGLAAGFDKNAEVPDAALALGFGFAEVGTITPRPQPGNPRPRIFRLPADRAVINRLGFNNEGFDAAERRLNLRQRQGVIGVNIGANRDSVDRVADYADGVRRVSPLADYITVNVSSPNTPGLRDLQERSALAELLAAVTEARRGAARTVPILLKLAPDLDDASLEAIVATALETQIDGLIVSNTTIARGGLRDTAVAAEAGGLSGRPLFRRSTAMLAKLRRLCGERLVLVGVGGIDSVESAWTKLTAGADLIQLYTGLVYEGLRLPSLIVDGLARRLDREGISAIGDIVGSDAERLSKTG